ncbi:hypothetical protein N7522_010066 [Penicillium canescens]|nr:hypothetical protein N7522_010066 [Penicillium canescens]
MSGFYKSEVQACNTFKDIQDIDIPKHFACVAVPTSQETQLSYTTKGFAWLTLLHTPRERADVRTRSFIVRGNMGNEFKPVMIDFALCKFPEEFEDEEGATGCHM